MTSLNIAPQPVSVAPPQSNIGDAIATATKTFSRFNDTLQRIHTDRYTKGASALARFFYDTPGVNFLTHGAVVALGVVNAIHIMGTTAPTAANVGMWALSLLAAVAACVSGSCVAKARDNYHATSLNSPISYDEVKDFVDEMRGMTPEQRAALAPEIARWGEERVRHNGISAPAFALLRDTAAANSSTDVAYAAAGEAYGFSNAILGNYDASAIDTHVAEFVAKCDTRVRAQVAGFLRERFFDGERCIVPNLEGRGAQIQKLYDILTKV